MIHLYTGDGKGKTTAALGLALRASGHGMITEVLCFLKDGASGEVCAGKHLPGVNVTCYQTQVQGFYWELDETQKQNVKMETQKGFLHAMKCASRGLCHVLILDELAGCLSNGILSEKDVLDFLRTYRDEMEIVLTGRDFPRSIRLEADYISEINAVKHPYTKGIGPRVGVEF